MEVLYQVGNHNGLTYICIGESGGTANSIYIGRDHVEWNEEGESARYWGSTCGDGYCCGRDWG